MADLQTYKGARFIDVWNDDVLDIYDTWEPTPIGTWEDGIVATYRFLDTDWSVIASWTCKDGETPVAPTDPTKIGYTFNWWDKPIWPIYVDTDYTAQWTINNYTVTLGTMLNYNDDTGEFVTWVEWGSVSKTSVTVPYESVCFPSYSHDSETGYTIRTFSFQPAWTRSELDSIVVTSLPDSEQYLYDILMYDPETGTFWDMDSFTVEGDMTIENLSFMRETVNYNISINTDGNGTVDENSLLVPYGTLVTISWNTVSIPSWDSSEATANSWYEFSKWTFDSTVWTTATSFTMTHNVTLYANFQSTVVSVTWVSLTEHNVTMSAGQTHQFTAIVTPADATNQNVTWEAHNLYTADFDQYLSISDTWLLSVRASAALWWPGIQVKVTTVDGGFTDTATVTA